MAVVLAITTPLRTSEGWETGVLLLWRIGNPRKSNGAPLLDRDELVLARGADGALVRGITHSVLSADGADVQVESARSLPPLTVSSAAV